MSVAAIVAATGHLHAQYATDALRFSQTTYGGTARFKALAGAQIGVGGDLSSLGANPAGLGLFTRSELSITPEFNSFNAKSVYLNGNNISSKDQLTLAHAGMVWNNPAYKRAGSDLNSGFLGYSAGIGYNRTNVFGNNTFFSGANFTSSIADYFAQLATTNYTTPKTLPSGTLERMAYDNYLIEYNNTTKKYSPETALNNDQSRSELRGGAQSELNFAFGANYSNKFYIGFGLALTNINYSSQTEYKEEGLNYVEKNDYKLSYRQNQLTKGSGINGRLGVIFKPAEMIRLGVTFETPSYYQISDSYTEALDTKYGKSTVDSSFTSTPQTYDFAYGLRTPAKLSGGASLFFGNRGFIAADIDYVNYANIIFTTKNNENAGVISSNNTAVTTNYKSAVNYRVGGEYKISSLMLRGGYAVQGSPYKNVNNPVTTYSGGIGYRASRYHVDLTYQNVSYNTEIKPYTLAAGKGPSAMVTNTRNNVFLTVGARF